MIEAVVDGVLASPPVICLALAYGIVYGLLGVMDLTFGVRMAVAGYSAWMVVEIAGLSGHPAFSPILWAAAILGVTLLGVLCWVLLAPLQKGHGLAVLVGSLGISVVMSAVLQFCFGASPRTFAMYPVETGLRFLGSSATPLQLCSLAYAALATLGVGLFLQRTRLGRKLDVVASDRELAQTVFGMREKQIAWAGMILASAIMAPAGLLHSIGSGILPETGTQQGLLAFVAAIAAGRRRPLAAPAVGMVLVCLGSIATRWSILGLLVLGFFVSAGFLVNGLMKRARMSRRTRTCISALGILAVLPFVILLVNGLGPLADNSILGKQIPGAFQPLVPYFFVIVALLWRPQGVLAFRKARAV